MKKLIITGASGTGKTNCSLQLSDGKPRIVLSPHESVQDIIIRIQKGKYEYVILEEANAFDSSFLTHLLHNDQILNQSEDATLIIILQNIPTWAYLYPIYKMEYCSFINCHTQEWIRSTKNEAVRYKIQRCSSLIISDKSNRVTINTLNREILFIKKPLRNIPYIGRVPATRLDKVMTSAYVYYWDEVLPLLLQSHV